MGERKYEGFWIRKKRVAGEGVAFGGAKRKRKESKGMEKKKAKRKEECTLCLLPSRSLQHGDHFLELCLLRLRLGRRSCMVEIARGGSSVALLVDITA